MLGVWVGAAGWLVGVVSLFGVVCLMCRLNSDWGCMVLCVLCCVCVFLGFRFCRVVV